MSSTKEKFVKKIKLWFRSIVVVALVAITMSSILFSNAAPAMARRGGGRIGGGSFRAPTRSAPAPRSNPGAGTTYYGGNNYYGGGSGLFFLPFLFSGGGGGGLFGLLIVGAIAAAVLQSFRGNADIDGGITGLDSKVTLVKLQVGLLSSARELQTDLTRLAQDANTGDAEGLALILREATVSLLRHPEYWVYVSSAKEVAKFEQAEQKFNSLAMSQRSKLNAEVLSNVNSRLIEGRKSAEALLTPSGLEEDPSEYIVVTLLVAAAGDYLNNLPQIRSASELSQALSSIGAVPSDRVLALEVLWEPQSEKYTLSSDQVLSVYPELIRI